MKELYPNLLDCEGWIEFGWASRRKAAFQERKIAK